jgi:phage terminase large subunit-like protein
VSAALELLAGLVLDNGRRWGEMATEVQWADARAILAESGPRRHWLGRARGYSKTTDMAAVLVVLLLVLRDGSECVAAAADRDQAAILVRRMRGLITRSGLAKDFEVTAHRISCRRTGCVLQVIAADGASAWGLQPAVVVLDELPMWHPTDNALELYDALVTALPKTRGSRLIVMGTAGDPAGWAARLHKSACKSSAWSEPAGPAPWMDRADVEHERASRPESVWRRLFMNEWVASEDRLVDPADLAACATLDGPCEPDGRHSYRIGVDLGLRDDRTAVACCHAETVEGGRRVVLDRLLVFAVSKGREVRLADVEAGILELSRRYRARVTCDPWQAIGMVQRLKARGVSIVEYPFSSASVGKLANTLHVLLRDRLLALPDDRELLDELANVRLRETSPGVLRMDHDPGRHDDRALALALSAQALLASPAGRASLRAARGQLPRTPIGRSTGEASFSPISDRSMTAGRSKIWRPGDRGLRHLPGPHRDIRP